MRKPHVLKRNKSQAAPRYLVFFDSESRVTADGEHIPYLICAEFWDLQNPKNVKKICYDKEFLSHFWRDVADHGPKKSKIWVLAHNAGYDILATAGIPRLVEAGFKVTNFFEKGSTYILFLTLTEHYIDKTGKNREKVVKGLQIISSTNFYNTTLTKLGEVFGLKKLEFDYAQGSDADALFYCKRDVEILRTSILKFIEFVKLENLGVLGQTTPGQAFNAYRHRFMTNSIFIHSHPHVIELERAAYYGGRVECWKIGEFSGNFFGFDINSMYPYVMKNQIYPTGLVGYRKKGKLKDLEVILNRGQLVCAHVRIETKEPVFPVKLATNLVFPIGNFWTHLSTAELRYALEHDLIREVEDFSIYAGADIFSDYIEYFYNKRREAQAEGDKIHELLYKSFLLSLYGKFGQKSARWEGVETAPGTEVWAREILNIDTGERENFKCFGGNVFKQTAETEGYNAFCAIATHVTAYARMYLYELIKIAKFENIFYMDTDSLFVNLEGAENLIAAGYVSETELGKMKLEKQDTNIKINAPKDYQFAGVTKIKGVKRGSVPITDPAELSELGVKEGRAYLNTHWPKLFSFIKKGDLSSYHNVKRVKVISGFYNKGWLTDSGDVLPFVLVNSNKINHIIPWLETNYSTEGRELDGDEQEGRILKIYQKCT